MRGQARGNFEIPFFSLFCSHFVYFSPNKNESQSLVPEEPQPGPSRDTQLSEDAAAGEPSGASSSFSKKTSLKSKLAKRNYRSRSPFHTDSLLDDDIPNPFTSSDSSSSDDSSSDSDSSSATLEATPAMRKSTSAKIKSKRKRNRPLLEHNEESLAGLGPSPAMPLDMDTDTNDNADEEEDDDEEDGDEEEEEVDEDSEMSSQDEAEKINLDFLANPKAAYRFSGPRDFLYRQSGLSFNRGRIAFLRDPGHFQRQAAGCRFAVEKLELMYKLKGHDGCVNSLNFNASGSLLASGSDDLKIMLWRWASNEMMYQFESTHITNVFQTKFMNLGGNQAINIISSARDGQVIHHELPSSGGNPVSNSLIKHTLPVHKIALPETSPFEVLTAGEDGYVIRCDLRDNVNERLVTAKVNNRRMALYSISAHPLKNEFCVSGRDQFVRVYDRRNLKSVMSTYCPPHLLNLGQARHISNITCAVYNYLGNEILASYSDDDIYLFDTSSSTPGSYLHKYQGHQNTCTIKGVNFFGPRSEFVMSGSDCGNCFFWDKQNESIVQWMAADEKGSVNVLEPHPSFPFVATSGIDDDIKIWVSSSEKVSDSFD